MVGYPTSKCPGIPKYLVPYWDPLWWGTQRLSVPGLPEYFLPSQDPLWCIAYIAYQIAYIVGKKTTLKSTFYQVHHKPTVIS